MAGVDRDTIDSIRRHDPASLRVILTARPALVYKALGPRGDNLALYLCKQTHIPKVAARALLAVVLDIAPSPPRISARGVQPAPQPTALQLLCEYGNSLDVPNLRCMLQQPALAGDRDDCACGETPVMIALVHGRLHMLDVLLEAGAKCNRMTAWVNKHISPNCDQDWDLTTDMCAILVARGCIPATPALWAHAYLCCHRGLMRAVRAGMGLACESQPNGAGSDGGKRLEALASLLVAPLVYITPERRLGVYDPVRRLNIRNSKPFSTSARQKLKTQARSDPTLKWFKKDFPYNRSQTYEWSQEYNLRVKRWTPQFLQAQARGTHAWILTRALAAAAVLRLRAGLPLEIVHTIISQVSCQ